MARMAIVAFVFLLLPGGLLAETPKDDLHIALKLAELLRAARAVISEHQDLINAPSDTDKGLTGDRVLAEALTLYRSETGHDPGSAEDGSRERRLLEAQMRAIREVVDENQDTINADGIGFKGFIPAVFARLVNERFEEYVGNEARVKVTAPEALIRNRRARPDRWEDSVLAGKFASPGWEKGKAHTEVVEFEERPAFRMLVPEYYERSCLACHGEPAGEMDITGYPKEGGKEGDLGAAISILLFQ